MDLQISPIQALMWEERERLGTVPAPWGGYCAFILSRRGGWAVLSKGVFDLPAVEVVELSERGLRRAEGKCTSTR